MLTCVCLSACSKAPDVPHAHVSENTKKAEYQEGNVIDFECDSGYTSDQSSKFVCTSRGWHVVHQGTCFCKFNGFMLPSPLTE